MDGYDLCLSPCAHAVLLKITAKTQLRRIRARLVALVTAPYMGVVYDPVYEAARPPHEVRVTYAGHFGIYYTVDETARRVEVEFIEDCRRDPLARFRN